ncbi:MAG: TCR/Tet family MFS transporter [Polyangiaceae bacterium]|nr:TCR/Tet family MFS transporter [Polyangiaceae bacterium]
MSRSRDAGVAFILITLLLDTLGMGLVFPVLPRLVATFLGGDLPAASRYYGAFAAVYAAMQFIFAPILGGLSDRFGRRAVILSSLLGAALDYVLLSLAPDLAWLFIGRVIAGITGASFSAATAYIADVTPPEQRAQSFGLIGAAFGLGLIVGPALGGVLADLHLRLPFVVAAGLNFLNFLYGLFVLPESLAREHRRPFSFARANPLASLRNVARHPIVLGLTGTLICAFLAQMILQSSWALHGMSRFGWTQLDVGISLAVVGVASAVVQGGLIRLIMPRLRERRALIVGLLLNICGFIAFGLATRTWMMYATTLPFALGGISGPATQSLISREVGPSEQGEIQGSLSSLQSVTAIVGPLLATSLFARFTPEAASPRIQGAHYFAAALLNICGLLLALRLFARTPGRGAGR